MRPDPVRRQRKLHSLSSNRELDAETAKGLRLDEARRIENNIAKLPKLLGKD